jgi:2'-5' RNA ligase
LNANPQNDLFGVEPCAIEILIAIVPDAPLQQAIDAQRKRWQWPPGVSFAPRRRLHLTLQKPGWVHVDRLDEVHAALSDISVSEMHLVLRRHERWRVAVLRVEEHPALRDLQQRVALALLRLGLPVHPWTPHVTLARDIGQSAMPPTDTRPLHWHAADFSLIWSKRGPVVAHQELARYGARSLLPICTNR